MRSAIAALAQSRAGRRAACVAGADAERVGLGTAQRSAAQRSRLGDTGTFNTFKARFDASWEPDVFGGLHAAVVAADADAQASAASLGDVRVSIAAEVAVNYLQLRGLHARLAIATANLNSQEETLQITQWRTQAGLLTSVEVEQARTATAQTRAQIPLLQAVLAVPAISSPFTFVAPSPLLLAGGVGMTVLGVLWFECTKWVLRRKNFNQVPLGGAAYVPTNSCPGRR